MKVTVKRIAPIMYKHPRLQAEFEEAFYHHQLIEDLIQENKDLRVREGHLRDDLACANAQVAHIKAEFDKYKQDASKAAFATGEILMEAERKAQSQEALIDELNAQIDASESNAKFWKKAASENAEIAASAQREADSWERSAHEHGKQVIAMQSTIDRLEAQIVSMGKKNDNISAELAWFRAKAEEAIAELAKHEMGHYKRECEEWKETADELAEKCTCYKQERDMARDEARELRVALDDLTVDYDALVQTKRDYGEEIDRLRKVVTDLQTNRFTLDEIFSKIMVFAESCERIVPSTDQ